jgi:TPP-dependent pyruvate/acetoin dehydrogenase alpha subunit
MAPRLKGEEGVALLERMLTMRRFEELVIHMAAKHKDIGRNHLYIGHEGVGAAVMATLRDGDLAYTTHRNHGHLIARGIDPGKALAEIMGRAGGLNGGRGGTWHIADRARGFHSTSAMVGGSIGLAVGGALACKQAGKGNVSAALFGDGVLDEGISYEALNFASLYRLPVLFMCENNAKTGQRPSSMLAADRLTDVPQALRIAGLVVHGADIEDVYAAVTEAVARIRRDGAPVFIEAKLERWPGSHQLKPEFTTGITDIAMAWERDRIGGTHAAWIGDHDPILRYAASLIERGDLTREAASALDAEIVRRMDDARTFAEASPYPEADGATVGIFA